MSRITRHFVHRHPNAAERKILGALLEEVGPPELLRVIAVHVGFEHPDPALGDEIRSALMRIALDIQTTEAKTHDQR